jgi:hypothetical protein
MEGGWQLAPSGTSKHAAEKLAIASRADKGRQKKTPNSALKRKQSLEWELTGE